MADNKIKVEAIVKRQNFMLKPTKLANAAAVVAIVCQVLYIIVVAVAPNLVYLYVDSMVPGYDFSAIKSSAGMSYGITVLGIVLMAVSVWVMVYVVVWLYNKFINSAAA